jgi:hypothetical protein
MKNIIGAAFAVVLIAGVAWAGQFGPPEPTADRGKFSLGMGYSLDRSEVKVDHDTLTAKSNQLYLQGSYTFMKDWETYGRVGGASLKLDNDGADFRDRMRGFGGLGLKGVAYRYQNLAIGPFVESSLYRDHRDSIGGNDVKVKDQWDLNLGVAAQYRVPVGGCDLTVYGGPFAYWNRSTIDVTGNGLSASEDAREKNNIGGFLGVKVPIVKQKMFLTAECQFKDKAGTGIYFSYIF